MQKGFKPDFYFTLAVIAIFGSTAGIFFKLQEASSEVELLSSSMAPLVRSRNGASDINETLRLNQELSELELQLEMLDLSQ